jgi:diguanylate cyclase (GGDEF)-like protein
MYLTTHSYGPFGVWPGDSAVPRDLALQIYFGFHLVALFPASIMFMERRRLTVDLHETNSRLTILASLDGLTGIANRRSFDERLASEWTRASRHRQPIALAMIDLDHFKEYNDLYGHVAGDRCLSAVAQALSRQVQGPENLVARFGGEEFALLLPHTGLDGARQVSNTVRSVIDALDMDHIGNAWNRVTVSIGFAALTPGAGDGPSRLIQLADAALYLAKSGGRNRVETMTSTLGSPASQEHGNTTKRRIIRILGGSDP